MHKLITHIPKTLGNADFSVTKALRNKAAYVENGDSIFKYTNAVAQRLGRALRVVLSASLNYVVSLGKGTTLTGETRLARETDRTTENCISKGFGYLFLFVTFSAVGTSAVWAESPEEKGLAIAKEVDERDIGWVDSTADFQMILRNSQGQESKRKIRLKTLEVEGDGDKSLSIFDTPKDVKGTAFLSFTHSVTPDDQWLYLPALKRVKRISSSNKSGPFMGSEFAFEDLSSQEVDKYTYKWLRDEALDGKDTLVIERYPEYKHSGYTRTVVWIDAEIYMPLKVEFYDRKNALLKTLIFTDYKQYEGKFWRPDSQEMVNHLTNKSTSLIWNNYQFTTGLTDRDFDKNSLKRAR